MCITIVCINVAYFFHHADQTTHQATMKILKDIIFCSVTQCDKKVSFEDYAGRQYANEHRAR